MNREQLVRRHRELSAEYHAYLLDPIRVLEQPLLNDVGEPLTGDFIEAFAQLEDFSAHIDQGLEPYRDLVERAWKTWRVARSHAEEAGLSAFGDEARKKVRTAQKLLALVLDPATSEFEKEAAHQQALKLLSGVVRLPQQARSVLATHTGRELPSSS